ncbi:hypothetical protein H6769_03955 [Candidatus Peribacteria bacterium]|nr:hypothetical protein [Candidatus Peribacteria bacterium]
MNIVTVTPGYLVDDTVDGHVIDTMITGSDFSGWFTILAGDTNMPSNIAFETPYASIACTSESSFLDVTPYGCTGSTSSTDFYVGSQHDLGITFPAAIIPPPNTPIGLAVTPGDSEVTVGWNPVNTATSYTLAWEADNG